MQNDHETLILKIADLYLDFIVTSNQIELDVNSTVLHYSCLNKIKEDYTIYFSLSNSTQEDYCNWSFVGKPEKNAFLNYSWYVKNSNDHISIRVNYDDYNHIDHVVAIIFPQKNKVEIRIILTEECNNVIKIDPLLHPLGSLLLLYLVHFKQGLLMHASAVIDNKNAYLFTGVSGIGKSTMARLWQGCGSDVINDDRVILRLIENQVVIYNNPMPYYRQQPKESNLKSIFLLSQSQDNYIKPLEGVMAFSKVLGNFIQQFYDKEMVKKHLEYIEEVVCRVNVYEVGFKPDHDIVTLIRELNS